MKPKLKEQFSITKAEWNGLVVMLLLMALIIAAPYIYRGFRKDNTINAKEFAAAVALLEKQNAGRQNTRTGLAVHFDPNSASYADWQRHGLTDAQARTIANYLAKGGRFRKPADLKKIYGITDSDYTKLAPLIKIRQPESHKPQVIEINSADSARLVGVEGIGPAFAKRIIYYRERLGGFVNKEQLKEVFGIDAVKYDEIQGQVSVNPRRIRKININTITFDKLRLLPYLNYKQVNAIIEYRKQHGSYTDINDLAAIAIIDEQILRKIEPYLIYK